MKTKDLVLEEALKQFSEKGYAGTSMSDIAKPLGISKAALYKHFESKQQIFDIIIEESEKRFEESLSGLLTQSLNGEAENASGDRPDVSEIASGEDLCERVLSFVKFSLSDPYSVRVRHMLTMSQFENKKLAEMYSKRYAETMLDYYCEVFEGLMEKGLMKRGDIRHLALMFYAPVIMYTGIWDREPDRGTECEEAIRKHVMIFYSLTKDREGKNER